MCHVLNTLPCLPASVINVVRVISATEFMDYVQLNKRVNQQWLRHTTQEQPCVVANALVHYQSLMRFSNLARGMRRQCEGRLGFLWDFIQRIGLPQILYNAYAYYYRGSAAKKTCDLKNWKLFKNEYGEGPAYFEEKRGSKPSKDMEKCLAILSTA